MCKRHSFFRLCSFYCFLSKSMARVMKLANNLVINKTYSLGYVRRLPLWKEFSFAHLTVWWLKVAQKPFTRSYFTTSSLWTMLSQYILWITLLFLLCTWKFVFQSFLPVLAFSCHYGSLLTLNEMSTAPLKDVLCH